MMKKVVWLSVLAVALVAVVLIRRSNGFMTLAATRQALYYVDPMHPAYRSASPGIAPDCSMNLIPVYAEDLEQEDTSRIPAVEPIHIDSEVRQRYGIQIARVENSEDHERFRAYGRVTADKTKIYRVALGADGYVKQTMGDAIGSRVVRNQHLAVIYSPDFLSVAGGYLSANERPPGSSSKDGSGQSSSLNASGATARADRLRNLGMSDAQIEEISVTRKIPEDIYVVSPVDGFILSRDISSGMRFEKHAEFYRIADLSHVWIVAEVFGSGSALFKQGAVARVTLPETGENFTAKVRDILPEIDPETHALKPRLELSNPGLHLCPGMYVDIEVLGSLRKGFSIPAEAVINAGAVKRVFVETGKDRFEPRDVDTGWNSGDRTQIVRGLKEGDQVIASGTFLLDSEVSIHLH